MSLWQREPRSTSHVVGFERTQMAHLAVPTSGKTCFSHASNEDAANALSAMARSKRGDLHLVAGNDIARHWLQAAPQGVASFAELRLIAQARCADLFGGSPADWRVTGQWCVDRPFVCAAIPEDLASRAEAAVAANGRVRPRWNTSWGILSCIMSEAFPDDGWCGVRGPAEILLWRCTRGYVTCIATWPTDADQEAQEVLEQAFVRLRMESSRAGSDLDPVLQWMDLVAGVERSVPLAGGGRVVTMKSPLDGSPAARREAEVAALLGSIHTRGSP